MKIEIYGSENCPYCVKSKQMCAAYELEYAYYDIGNDTTERSALDARLGYKVMSVPQIFVNGVHLPGGFKELATVIAS